MPIISADEVAALLGVAATDSFLVALVAGANRFALTECRPRTFELGERVEYVRGFGLDFVFLRESPITVLTEVRIDPLGVFGDDTIVDPSNFFWVADVDDPRLWVKSTADKWTAWPEGPRIAKVTYTAGYAPASDGAPAGPEDLRAELISDVCAMFKLGPEMSGFVSLRQGDVSYGRFAGGVSERLKMAIRRNRWKGI